MSLVATPCGFLVKQHFYKNKCISSNFFFLGDSIISNPMAQGTSEEKSLMSSPAFGY